VCDRTEGSDSIGSGCREFVGFLNCCDFRVGCQNRPVISLCHKIGVGINCLSRCEMRV
jgi:hypothetical protein